MKDSLPQSAVETLFLAKHSLDLNWAHMNVTNCWQSWRAWIGLSSAWGIFALRELQEPLAGNSKTTGHSGGHIIGHTKASSQGHSIV